MDKPRKYSPEEILRFLRQYPIMSLAASLDGQPVSSVVVFAIEDDFSLYFTTHSESYKARALRQNSAISISVFEINTMLVQAGGHATELFDEDQRGATKKVTAALDALTNFWPPILRFSGETFTSFHIKLDWVRALDLSSPSYDGLEDPFSTFKLT